MRGALCLSPLPPGGGLSPPAALETGWYREGLCLSSLGMRGFCVFRHENRAFTTILTSTGPRHGRPERAGAMKMKASKALLEQLKLHGVQVMFGYPGGAVIPLYDAIYEEEDIR